jgi:leucyl-tRNA synthetase
LVEKHAPRLREVNVAVGFSPAHRSATPDKEKALLRKAHQTLKRVSSDLESRWHFNTSVALLMELVNEMYAQEPLDEGADPAVVREVFELLTLMLAPVAPHVAEEMWEMLGHEGGAWHAAWPQYNAELAREEQFEVVVQVNGKVRGRILVEDGLSEEETVARAVADPKIAAMVNGKRVLKTIVVPNKLVNLVIV